MTTPKPDALTSNYCAHAAELRMRDELPCPWCVIDELKRNRSQFAERLADCEISLGTFAPGAASEYWLKYAPGAMYVPVPETPQPTGALHQPLPFAANCPHGISMRPGQIPADECEDCARVALIRPAQETPECRMTPVPAEPSNYPKPGAAQKATVRYPGMQICRKYTQNGPCLNEIDHQGECDGLPHL